MHVGEEYRLAALDVQGSLLHTYTHTLILTVSQAVFVMVEGVPVQLFFGCLAGDFFCSDDVCYADYQEDRSMLYCCCNGNLCNRNTVLRWSFNATSDIPTETVSFSLQSTTDCKYFITWIDLNEWVQYHKPYCTRISSQLFLEGST